MLLIWETPCPASSSNLGSVTEFTLPAWASQIAFVVTYFLGCTCSNLRSHAALSRAKLNNFRFAFPLMATTNLSRFELQSLPYRHGTLLLWIHCVITSLIFTWHRHPEYIPERLFLISIIFSVGPWWYRYHSLRMRCLDSRTCCHTRDDLARTSKAIEGYRDWYSAQGSVLACWCKRLTYCRQRRHLRWRTVNAHSGWRCNAGRSASIKFRGAKLTHGGGRGRTRNVEFGERATTLEASLRLGFSTLRG